MMTVAAGAGGGPLRSESARLPSVTLARAAPGPPVQLRWTTLRVQGPTLRDAALANGGNGSPPVAPAACPRSPHSDSWIAKRAAIKGPANSSLPSPLSKIKSRETGETGKTREIAQTRV